MTTPDGSAPSGPDFDGLADQLDSLATDLEAERAALVARLRTLEDRMRRARKAASALRDQPAAPAPQKKKRDTSQYNPSDAAREEVMATLRDAGGAALSVRQVAEVTGRSRTHTARTLSVLRSDGEVRVAGVQKTHGQSAPLYAPWNAQPDLRAA